MLQNRSVDKFSFGPAGDIAAEPRARLDLRDALNALRKYSVGIALWVLICDFGAAIYVANTPSQYVAYSQVILEPRRSANSSAPGSPVFQVNIDNSQIESQLQVAKSEKVLKFVFTELHLQDDPEFSSPQPGLSAQLKQIVLAGLESLDRGSQDGPLAQLESSLRSSIANQVNQNTPASQERRDALAYANFADRVQVRRIGQSLVLEISFRSLSPTRAASIANSITAAYIRDQVESRLLSMRRDGEWLQSRVDEIKSEEAASLAAIKQGVEPDMQFAASDARILSAAEEPLSRSFPQTGLTLTFAAAFALLTGLLAASVRNSLDRTIHSPKLIPQQLGLNCLGVAPKIGRNDLKGRRRSHLYNFVANNRTSAFAHAMRMIRASIMGSEHGKRQRRLGVVSCFAGEGKSTVAGNLAYTLALAGARTLLIDADIQKSGLTRAFAPNAAFGLYDMLSDEPNANKPLPLTERLDFVPAMRKSGGVDRNAGLPPGTTETFLNKLEDYEFVIFDLPPLTEPFLPLSVAPILDGMILVLESGKTTIDEVGEGQDILAQSSTNILGAILNKAPRTEWSALLRNARLEPQSVRLAR